tara:strand:- start:3203 stop:3418 length:216 start_codon:yes stop_codon:yes gene_type:complete
MFEALQFVAVLSEFCEALSFVKFQDPNKRLGDLLMLETDLAVVSVTSLSVVSLSLEQEAHKNNNVQNISWK